MATLMEDTADWLTSEQLLFSCGRTTDESFAGLSSQLLNPPCGYVNALGEATLAGRYVDTFTRLTDACESSAPVPANRLPLQQLRDLSLYQRVPLSSRDFDYGENGMEIDVNMNRPGISAIPLQQLAPPSPPPRPLPVENLPARRGPQRAKRAASSPPEHRPARQRARFVQPAGLGQAHWGPSHMHDSPCWGQPRGPSSPCFDLWTPDEELRRPIGNRLSRMLTGNGSLLGKLTPFSMLKPDNYTSANVKLSDINNLIQSRASSSPPKASMRDPRVMSKRLYPEPPQATITTRPMSAPSPGMSQDMCEHTAWLSSAHISGPTMVRTIAKHDVPGTNITFRRVSTTPNVQPFRL